MSTDQEIQKENKQVEYNDIGAQVKHFIDKSQRRDMTLEYEQGATSLPHKIYNADTGEEMVRPSVKEKDRVFVRTISGKKFEIEATTHGTYTASYKDMSDEPHQVRVIEQMDLPTLLNYIAKEATTA